MVSAIYVYFMVPEIAGLSVEEIDHLFTGSWFNAHKRSKGLKPTQVGASLEIEGDPEKVSDPEQCEAVFAKPEKSTAD